MNRLLSAFLMIVLTAAAAAMAASAEPRDGGDVVKLAPIEVKASRPDFEFDVRYDDVSTKVQEVLVTWVSPGTHQRGLRVGDRMAFVDGKRIDELTVEVLLAATKRKLGPGESQDLIFTGTRMLFRRATVTYMTRGPKASEPAPRPVSDRADARSAPAMVVAHP